MEHNDRQVKSNTFAAYMICMTLILVTLIGSVTFCYFHRFGDRPVSLVPITETTTIKIIEVDNDRFIAIMNDKYVEVSSSWEISIVPIENLDNEPGEEL